MDGQQCAKRRPSHTGFQKAFPEPSWSLSDQVATIEPQGFQGQ